MPVERSDAFGPGRVNLIGEHTDYNQGLALPFAIAEGVTVRAQALGGDAAAGRGGAPKVEAFAGQMVGNLNGATLMLMTSIGHHTGLLDTMGGLPPATERVRAIDVVQEEQMIREPDRSGHLRQTAQGIPHATRPRFAPDSFDVIVDHTGVIEMLQSVGAADESRSAPVVQ